VLLHCSSEWPNHDVRNMSLIAVVQSRVSGAAGMRAVDCAEVERDPAEHRRRTSIRVRTRSPHHEGLRRELLNVEESETSVAFGSHLRIVCAQASNMSMAAWRIQAQASGPMSAKNAFSVACRSALFDHKSGRSADPRRASAGSAPFLGGDDRALVDRRFDLEVVPQTLHAGQADVRGREAVLHRLADVRDARPVVRGERPRGPKAIWLRWTLSFNSPYPAWRTMFRASSEIAVTIIVWSVAEKPRTRARSRPFWRAVKTPVSEQTSTRATIGGRFSATGFLIVVPESALRGRQSPAASTALVLREGVIAPPRCWYPSSRHQFVPGLDRTRGSLDSA